MAKHRICSVKGCGKKHYSRGWCQKHYYSNRDVPQCAIAGCGKRSLAKGWCGAHYARWLRHGSPTAGGAVFGAPEQFYQENVLTHDADGCLIWPYTRNSNGYAQLYRKGKHYLVSRLICEVMHGPPPSPEYEAAHNCGNGREGCVNRHHIVWKTRAENMADLEVHGTLIHGERCHFAKLREPDVRRIRALGGTMLQRDIAAIFGVSVGAIQAVLSGKSWRRLE